MSSGRIVPLLPRFPRVRCDGCRRVYRLTDAQLAASPIVGGCPRCGHVRFSTTMVAGPAA